MYIDKTLTNDIERSIKEAVQTKSTMYLKILSSRIQEALNHYQGRKDSLDQLIEALEDKKS